MLAIFYPDLKSFFSLLGGFFGTILVVLFPGLTYICLEKENKWRNYFIMFGMLVILVFGFMGGVIS